MFSAFRFTADWTVILPTTQFESALDRFMAQIQGKLRADRVAPTNFDQIWTSVDARLSRLGDRAIMPPAHCVNSTDWRTNRCRTSVSQSVARLEAFLDGDYSEQAREDAAEHFSVSERTVWTLLGNNGRLEQHAPDDDAETLDAAA